MAVFPRADGIHGIVEVDHLDALFPERPDQILYRLIGIGKVETRIAQVSRIKARPEPCFVRKAAEQFLEKGEIRA